MAHQKVLVVTERHFAKSGQIIVLLKVIGYIWHFVMFQLRIYFSIQLMCFLSFIYYN